MLKKLTIDEICATSVIYAIQAFLASTAFISTVVVMGGWLKFSDLHSITPSLLVGVAIYAAFLTKLHVDGSYDNSWIPKLLSVAWYSALLSCVLYVVLRLFMTAVAFFISASVEAVAGYVFAVTSILSVAGAIFEVWHQRKEQMKAPDPAFLVK